MLANQPALCFLEKLGDNAVAGNVAGELVVGGAAEYVALSAFYEFLDDRVTPRVACHVQRTPVLSASKGLKVEARLVLSGKLLIKGKHPVKNADVLPLRCDVSCCPVARVPLVGINSLRQQTFNNSF